MGRTVCEHLVVFVGNACADCMRTLDYVRRIVYIPAYKAMELFRLALIELSGEL